MTPDVMELANRLRDNECPTGCGSMKFCICASAADAADAIEAQAAEIARLREVMTALDKAASEVLRLGAVTGPQWSKLTVASLKARATLNGGKP